MNRNQGFYVGNFSHAFIIKASIVIFNSGIDIEQEQLDKRDINLPGKQLQLLQDAVAAGNLIFDLYRSTPYFYSALEEVNEIT